jgi:hypothetical protein
MPTKVRFDSFRVLGDTNRDLLSHLKRIGLPPGKPSKHVVSCWTAEVTLSSTRTLATMSPPRLLNKSSVDGQHHEYCDYTFTEADMASLVPFLTYIANVVHHAFHHDVLEIGWVKFHEGLFGDEHPVGRTKMLEAGWLMERRPSTEPPARRTRKDGHEQPFWVHRTKGLVA